LVLPHHLRSTLFPYTTLFRSQGPHQALFAEVDGDHQGRELPPLEPGAGAGREGSERAHGAVIRLPRLQGRRAELRPAPEPRLRVAPGRLRGATERVELGVRGRREVLTIPAASFSLVLLAILMIPTGARAGPRPLRIVT